MVVLPVAAAEVDSAVLIWHILAIGPVVAASFLLNLLSLQLVEICPLQ